MRRSREGEQMGQRACLRGESWRGVNLRDILRKAGKTYHWGTVPRKSKNIPEFFHTFYLDAQKGCWGKSQFEGKGHIFSVGQVAFKARAGNSLGSAQLVVGELEAVQGVTTSRESAVTLWGDNEGTLKVFSDCAVTLLHHLAAVWLWFHSMKYMSFFSFLCFLNPQTFLSDY